MSELLEQAACSDAQRREDLARNDAAMAHGITRVSLARVSGKHLSDAANEPTEEDKIAADLAEDSRKSERRHAISDRCAIELQVQNLRNGGLL